MGTRVTSCELHLTIFHMRVQYVSATWNVHVEYTDQLSIRVFHMSYRLLSILELKFNGEILITILMHDIISISV